MVAVGHSMFEARFVCTILGFDVAAEMAVLWAAAAAAGLWNRYIDGFVVCLFFKHTYIKIYKMHQVCLCF